MSSPDEFYRLDKYADEEKGQNMASEDSKTYQPLVAALIAATKELDKYNIPECYGIVTLLRNLECTRRTNIDAAKALKVRIESSLEGE